LNASHDKGNPFASAVMELSAQFPHHAHLHLINAYDAEWEESTKDGYSGNRRNSAQTYES
jgi:hypothetical protein